LNSITSWMFFSGGKTNLGSLNIFKLNTFF